MLLDDIKYGDMVVFANGDEAIVTGTNKGIEEEKILLLFNKKVLGKITNSYSWEYKYDGKWIGGGNNIVKVIHMSGD